MRIIKQFVSKKLGITRKRNFLIEEDMLKDFLKALAPYDMDLIRVGGKFDGGYLIPKLSEIDFVFSPGVNDSDEFEIYFANHGIDCFLADYSVKSNPSNHDKIIFDRVYIGYNNEINFISLDNWVNKYVSDSNKKGILQMDIEGWEYNNLINASDELLKKFNVLVIEFHEFDKILFKKSFYFMDLIFKKIHRLFDVVHIHPNTHCGFERMYNVNIPNVIEITFINKEINQSSTIRNRILHPLDQSNFPNENQIDIENWLN